MLRVPTNFDVGVSRGVLVGACDVGRPIANGLGAGTPDTRLFGGITRLVHVVVRGRRVPVARAGHGDDGLAVHAGWDKHSLISRENRLAEGHDSVGVVDGRNGTDSIDAVVFARVRLGNFTRVIAVQASVHGLWVDIGGAGLPLVHDLAWGASEGTVGAGGALFVRAHGPTGVHLAGRDRDKASVLGEGALSGPVGQPAAGLQLLFDLISPLAVVVSLLEFVVNVTVCVARGRSDGLSGQRQQS